MSRQSIIDKIRALLSKTIENGCTEAEAMAALAKASELMAGHEVEESELREAAADGAILSEHPIDKQEINFRLSIAVAKFCDCEVWRDGPRGAKRVVFCGLRSDVELAGRMLASLSQFVETELASYLQSTFSFEPRRVVVEGFVSGIVLRIAQRLRDLRQQLRASSNAQALVVVKQEVIKAKIRAMELRFASAKHSRQRSADSFADGKARGEAASFGRPVSGSGAVLRIGSSSSKS